MGEGLGATLEEASRTAARSLLKRWTNFCTEVMGKDRLNSFATHALRAVQELLGHSSVTTTQRYTHMEADDLRQQVAELPANGFRQF